MSLPGGHVFGSLLLRTFKLFAATCALLYLAACASTGSGADYVMVPIDTDPAGARATNMEGAWCRTPCELPLPGTAPPRISIDLEGYEPVHLELTGAVAPHSPGAFSSIGGTAFLGTALSLAGVFLGLAGHGEEGFWVTTAGAIISQAPVPVVEGGTVTRSPIRVILTPTRQLERAPDEGESPPPTALPPAEDEAWRGELRI